MVRHGSIGSTANLTTPFKITTYKDLYATFILLWHLGSGDSSISENAERRLMYNHRTMLWQLYTNSVGRYASYARLIVYARRLVK